MTVVSFPREEFERRIGKLTEEMEDLISSFGTPFEDANDEEILVDILPNRPDLLSFQNFARSFLIFLGKRKPSDFKVRKPEKDYRVLIDKSLKDIRPHTVCAIVKGLKLDDERIKEIIDIQEKLHNSVGRKRRKLAIGIYPLERISLPISFKAMKPEEIRFQPLEAPGEMTAKEILRKHPTGREYGNLLEGFEKYPVFMDSKGDVLSMPPIINSAKTGKVETSTKDVFIECSGENIFYLKKTLNIILSSLAEMGGEIYSMQIKDPVLGSFISPDMGREVMEFRKEDISKLLGVEFSVKEIKKLLERMDIVVEEKKGKLYALIPPQRFDVLHWVDLAEDAAIARGYDSFEAEKSGAATVGEESEEEKLNNLVAEILVGLGLLEVSTYHLTTKKNVKKTYFDFKDFAELEESKTERDVLRPDLLTQGLQIFSENSDASYPQEIFEIGRVFRKEEGVSEENHLFVGLAGESVDFTKIKQVMDNLFRMLGESYELEETENNAFISGRVGRILFKGDEIGVIGEVSPRVLKNWKIKVPVAAFEISLKEFI